MSKYTLKRDPKQCLGNTCLDCEIHLPGFITAENGSMVVSKWAYKSNHKRIDQAIAECRQGCITIE